jgi:2',3'-cyclic-nucleotide 2'-phosphodiesterase (5'-nucleotidase family)
MKFKFYIFILGAGLSACSFGKQTFVNGKSIPLSAEYPNSRSVDSIVSPYKIELDKEMNQVVAQAEVDFINQRPNGSLGFLVADILLEKGKEVLPNENMICLINIGGLRAPISKGNVLLGDVFKLMPFDNQFLLVKMPAKSIVDIQAYLKKSGGEPISGFKVLQDSILTADNQVWQSKDFWVVTSDYLMNGGDNMNFFQQKLEVKNPNLLLRNVILDGFKSRKKLSNVIDTRIKL